MMSQQENFKPESVENSSKQNAAIENLFRPEENNVAQVNPELQGDKAPMINDFLKQLGSAEDSKGFVALLTGKNSFNDYKQTLENKCFSKDGSVNPAATVENISQLYDLNNAVIAATTARADKVAVQMKKEQTMASFA